MDTIRVSDDIRLLTGIGTEYLVDAQTGQVLAKFYDGMLWNACPNIRDGLTIGVDHERT